MFDSLSVGTLWVKMSTGVFVLQETTTLLALFL